MGRYGSLLSVTDAGWLDYIVQGSSANNCRHLYLISIFTKFREQSQTTVVLFVVNSWTDRPMYCSSPLQRLLFLGAFQLILQARDSHVGSFRHRWGHTFALDKLFSEILHNPELRLPCPSLYGTLFQGYIFLKQAQPAYDGTCGTRPLHCEEGGNQVHLVPSDFCDWLSFSRWARLWIKDDNRCTCVSNALETFVITALYKSTFTIPYHTIKLKTKVRQQKPWANQLGAHHAPPELLLIISMNAVADRFQTASLL